MHPRIRDGLAPAVVAVTTVAVAAWAAHRAFSLSATTYGSAGHVIAVISVALQAGIAVGTADTGLGAPADISSARSRVLTTDGPPVLVFTIGVGFVLALGVSNSPAALLLTAVTLYSTAMLLLRLGRVPLVAAVLPVASVLATVTAGGRDQPWAVLLHMQATPSSLLTSGIAVAALVMLMLRPRW